MWKPSFKQKFVNDIKALRMPSFNIKSIAFKWYFFVISSFGVYAEFSHLCMKQLGLNPKQIGMTNIFGIQHMFITLVLFVDDRYRVRCLIIWIVSCLSVMNCLLPLLPIVVSLPTCFETSSSLKSGKLHWYSSMIKIC